MKKQQVISLALGSAFAVAAMGAQAASGNPFSAEKLDAGYQVAQADMKKKDGKCGEAKCGADKKMEKKAEAKCGADKSMDKKKDGSCGAGK